MLEKQLSSCGGSAEESSDNTTPNATSDGNTIAGGQVALNQTFKQQPTVIMKNNSLIYYGRIKMAILNRLDLKWLQVWMRENAIILWFESHAGFLAELKLLKNIFALSCKYRLLNEGSSIGEVILAFLVHTEISCLTLCENIEEKCGYAQFLLFMYNKVY